MAPPVIFERLSIQNSLHHGSFAEVIIERPHMIAHSILWWKDFWEWSLSSTTFIRFIQSLLDASYSVLIFWLNFLMWYKISYEPWLWMILICKEYLPLLILILNFRFNRVGFNSILVTYFAFFHFWGRFRLNGTNISNKFRNLLCCWTYDFEIWMTLVRNVNIFKDSKMTADRS